ncbi:MAG: LysM peptidoglycan-binding domain-containing protein [candidate division KSB1 bacterium]|nr:LysM peptidoglycan-binding domain-containing protein [candidate division KSB1 bacterium]MDZ7335654.1 LysM peptidoglycan-binding domain-containing protein [candidate division KSB1 bacterium]MDZ7357727.1 LysM peptidoglycan-binding domain-containing protein [candidate division KSB1 bacterium]MDZ7376779.1 LysM peptidoglycan-binding domain-containing protein [candidate division KSB1 bacterium]MDZ7402031.1 LysM peptidoglycan-binding domain-containing protein [candidate division KSB1 bacterium]
MIKFMIKSVIVLLAMQSAMNYLRNEQIIEGSIRINYSVIQQKLISAVPVRKIASGMVQAVAQTRLQRVSPEPYAAEYPVAEVREIKDVPAFKIVHHVVAEGESLAVLAQIYGVHWRVIQKINRIGDDEPLFVGQVLRIPTRTQGLERRII